MKAKVLLVLILLVGVLAGCNQGEPVSNDEQTSPEAVTDAVTTASIVDTGDTFRNAVSKDGNWIVAILHDLTLTEDVAIEGEFRNKGLAENDLYRKLALYSQDEDHNITATFTLTAPKVFVRSENLRVQGGTIKGDVYVEVNGFNLHETATVDGNIYFANDECKSTAAIDGKVTGTTEVVANTDVVTTASIVNTGDTFRNAVSKNGNWIVAILQDLTLTEDVAIEGEFRNKGLAENDLYRKLALYSQDEDHNITATFTLTAPKVFVRSENLRVQGGTIKGDVYVEVNGFNLHESATVDGNIYFANDECKSTAAIDGKVTGATEVQ